MTRPDMVPPALQAPLDFTGCLRCPMSDETINTHL